jgi:hypothetical protein
MASSTKEKAIVRATQAGRAVGLVYQARDEARFHDALTIAKKTGLLEGGRTELLRGRMPKALVAKARARTGVQSDTELIEMALATVAVADEYASWLLRQSGTVSKGVDLEL